MVRRVEPIHSFEMLRILADSRRLSILRLLMAAPATLTQLAHSLKRSPAWIRHHILALQAAGLVEVVEIRKSGRITEKFYRAKADALLLQEMILPKSRRPVLVFSGSHDLALEAIAENVSKQATLLSLPVGSLDGLVNLRQGLCLLAGAHLLDKSGEYNLPFIRRLFPDRSVEIVTLAYRTQGLMLAPGNPKGVKKLADLARPNVRFVNRNPGSGTRLWLDSEIRSLNIRPEDINGYDTSVQTHTEAADRIATSRADAALGLQAAAHRHGLEFIPLFEERYDLVLEREKEEVLLPILDYLQTASFRGLQASLPGYSTAHSGEQIPI